jgi:hypothetical protein
MVASEGVLTTEGHTQAVSMRRYNTVERPGKCCSYLWIMNNNKIVQTISILE